MLLHGCNTHFLLIKFFYFYVCLSFCLYDIVVFFIQKLRLKVNFLIFNLTLSKKLQPIQFPNYFSIEKGV
jgi:hypothetical protein